MKKLLFETPPIAIPVELAVTVGLNESIVIQQVHYWCEVNKKKRQNFRDEYYWTYNTFEGWQEQFPFWSVSTIKRIVTKLETQGYLISGNYNKMKIDRTKWYRINYPKLYGEEDIVERKTDLLIESCQLAGAKKNITSKDRQETIKLVREDIKKQRVKGKATWH